MGFSGVGGDLLCEALVRLTRAYRRKLDGGVPARDGMHLRVQIDALDQMRLPQQDDHRSLLAYALDACHIVVLANGEESTESGRFGSALRLDRRAPELLEPLRTVRTDRRALVLLITLVYTLL